LDTSSTLAHTKMENHGGKVVVQISEFSGNRTEFFARACQKRAGKWLQNLIVSQGLKTSSAWS